MPHTQTGRDPTRRRRPGRAEAATAIDSVRRDDVARPRGNVSSRGREHRELRSAGRGARGRTRLRCRCRSQPRGPTSRSRWCLRAGSLVRGAALAFLLGRGRIQVLADTRSRHHCAGTSAVRADAENDRSDDAAKLAGDAARPAGRRTREERPAHSSLPSPPCPRRQQRDEGSEKRESASLPAQKLKGSPSTQPVGLLGETCHSVMIVNAVTAATAAAPTAIGRAVMGQTTTRTFTASPAPMTTADSTFAIYTTFAMAPPTPLISASRSLDALAATSGESRSSTTRTSRVRLQATLVARQRRSAT